MLLPHTDIVLYYKILQMIPLCKIDNDLPDRMTGTRLISLPFFFYPSLPEIPATPV